VLNANFPVKCIAYSLDELVFPRTSFFKVNICDGLTKRHKLLVNGTNLTYIKNVDPYIPEICIHLENVSIPMNGIENKTLYVQFSAGGFLNLRFPYCFHKDAALIKVHSME